MEFHPRMLVLLTPQLLSNLMSTCGAMQYMDSECLFSIKGRARISLLWSNEITASSGTNIMRKQKRKKVLANNRSVLH